MIRQRSSVETADIQARLLLLHLSGMGPARIRWLLSRRDPVDVVARLRAGELPAPFTEAPARGRVVRCRQVALGDRRP